MGKDTQSIEQSHFDFEKYLGVDDHNFAEFPFFSVTSPQDRLRETLITEHVSDNKLVPGTKITRTQKIIASEEYGLPGERDGDVLLALMSLLRQSSSSLVPAPRRIYFTRREILRFMKWTDDGDGYNDLLEALHRWVATSYHYWNWWNDDIGAYGEVAFPVLTKFAGRNTAFASVEDETHYYVEFSEDFVSAFVGGGWSKTLDLDIYYSLSSPSAKLLYRFLDKRCRVGQPRHFDLRTLVTQHLGLKGVDKNGKPLPPSRLRTSLARAVQELEAIGFIQPATKSVRFGPVRGRDQRITFVRGEIEKKQAQTDHPLVVEMVELGMWEETAREIVANPKYDDDFIRERIELTCWKLRTKEEETPRDPGAYLARIIAKPRPLPANFETRAEQAARLAKANAAKTMEANSKAAAKQQTDDDRKRLLAEYRNIRDRLSKLPIGQSSEIEKAAMRRVPGVVRSVVWQWLKEGKSEDNNFARDIFTKAVNETLDNAS